MLVTDLKVNSNLSGKTTIFSIIRLTSCLSYFIIRLVCCSRKIRISSILSIKASCSADLRIRLDFFVRRLSISSATVSILSWSPTATTSSSCNSASLKSMYSVVTHLSSSRTYSTFFLSFSNIIYFPPSVLSIALTTAFCNSCSDTVSASHTVGRFSILLTHLQFTYPLPFFFEFQATLLYKSTHLPQNTMVYNAYLLL